MVTFSSDLKRIERCFKTHSQLIDKYIISLFRMTFASFGRGFFLSKNVSKCFCWLLVYNKMWKLNWILNSQKPIIIDKMSSTKSGTPLQTIPPPDGSSYKQNKNTTPLKFMFTLLKRNNRRSKSPRTWFCRWSCITWTFLTTHRFWEFLFDDCPENKLSWMLNS